MTDPTQSTGQQGEEPGGGQLPTAWIVAGVVALVVVLVGVWFLVSNDDDGEDLEAVSGSSTTTTSAPGSSSTDPSTTEAAVTTLPDESGGGITVPEGAATTPVSVPRPNMEPTGLVGVRTARHEGFDRVVFEFDGALPGYDVQYAQRPITEDGSGNEVAVDGAFVVMVQMDPASTVRFTDSGYEELYTGPDRIPGAGATVTEVVEVGDFEARSSWAVGLADEVDFAVSTLENPSRLVVDFVNH